MSDTCDSNCNVGASKTKNDDVCDVNDMLQNMSTEDNNNVSICANCGKEGANNVCNKCQSVKYCNAVCKKVHKKKHKKECEEHIRLATEKHNEELKFAAELHDIELFKEPPSQHGDCPICFLRLPSLGSGSKYYSCCGKFICSGCCYAPLYDNQGNEVDNKKCPFCRSPRPGSIEGRNKEIMKRVEVDDAAAMYTLGCCYRGGIWGFDQDYLKALKLFHRAGVLGHSEAYVCIGYAYNNGRGVERDVKKAKHYYELAAMKGSTTARYNLGIKEGKAGNINKALKHHMIATRSGQNKSLKSIKMMYSNGHATKELYTAALQAYQEYLGDVKSDQRDKAAAADESNRYY